jgi:hypothetical protein
VAADTNRPVRGARLQVTAPELPTPRALITDVNGRFEVKGLVAGRYTITASAAGFITLAYGQARPFETGKPIALTNGQVVDGLTLTLPRGGAIAGVVLDEQGRPLIGAVVMASRPQFVRGIQQLVPVGTSTSNDIGEFRISGLLPGALFVSARKIIGVSKDTESGYGTTFFPGTRTIAGARPVTVRLGQTTAGITLPLDPRGTGAITVSAPDVDGRPLPLAFFTVRRSDGFVDIPSGVAPPGGSTFEVAALAPGEYELSITTAVSAGRGASPASVAPRFASSKFVLGGEPVIDVRLVTNAMPALAGRVVVDPLARASLSASSIKLGTIPVSASDLWSYQTTVPPVEDLTFSMFAPPGRLHIRPTLPKGWALKAVRLKGEDVTDSGIEMQTGTDIRDVEVEVTDRVPTVSGSVRNARGERVTDYTVLFFARDRDRWQGDGRYVVTVRPDQTGVFSSEALVPGDYYVAALDYLDPGEAQNPALLDRLQRDASAVVLREASTTTLDLRILPGGQP